MPAPSASGAHPNQPHQYPQHPSCKWSPASLLTHVRASGLGQGAVGSAAQHARPPSCTRLPASPSGAGSAAIRVSPGARSPGIRSWPGTAGRSAGGRFPGCHRFGPGGFQFRHECSRATSVAFRQPRVAEWRGRRGGIAKLPRRASDSARMQPGCVPARAEAAGVCFGRPAHSCARPRWSVTRLEIVQLGRLDEHVLDLGRRHLLRRHHPCPSAGARSPPFLAPELAAITRRNGRRDAEGGPPLCPGRPQGRPNRSRSRCDPRSHIRRAKALALSLLKLRGAENELGRQSVQQKRDCGLSRPEVWVGVTSCRM